MSDQRSVLVVGAGLIGTSVALALRERRHHVWLADTRPSNLHDAEELGAGVPHRGETAEIVVVAVPPASTAQTVAQRLRESDDATVTDTAGIKRRVHDDVQALVAGSAHAGASHFVGGHPLAGRERGGPRRARPTLFAGRAWVLTPGPSASADALSDARWLAEECGASPLVMTPQEHDDAVALTSHLPQIVASALAAQFGSASDAVLELAGQGLRDMTRIAAADPEMWAQIATGNSSPLASALEGLAETLRHVAASLRDGHGEAGVTALVEDGRNAQRRLPGKHGGAPRTYRIVGVLVPDEPGQLARVLADTAAAGVNVEDLRVEHAPGLPVGLIELFVGPESAGSLRAALTHNGWSVVDEETT
ncbi:MAG: prephenate dehydrogenase [Candidatus Dormibacteria bacterium]